LAIACIILADVNTKDMLPGWAADIRLYDGEEIEIVEDGAVVHVVEYDTYKGYALMSNNTTEYLGTFKYKREATYAITRCSKRAPL